MVEILGEKWRYMEKNGDIRREMEILGKNGDIRRDIRRYWESGIDIRREMKIYGDKWRY